MKNDSIKVILSTLTAIGGIGGTYKTMEDRVLGLEMENAEMRDRLVELGDMVEETKKVRSL